MCIPVKWCNFDLLSMDSMLKCMSDVVFCHGYFLSHYDSIPLFPTKHGINSNHSDLIMRLFVEIDAFRFYLITTLQQRNQFENAKFYSSTDFVWENISASMFASFHWFLLLLLVCLFVCSLHHKNTIPIEPELKEKFSDKEI